MTYVSNDPSWWPLINFDIFVSYWGVAAGVVVVYDWVSTLGQEIELIWRQRWSLMTVLYLIVHTLYWNPVFCSQSSGHVSYAPCSIFLTGRHRIFAIGIADRCSTITYYAYGGTIVALSAMLGIIVIARLHAMYQGSRKMLMFLVIIFLAVNIACGVMVAIPHHIAEEFILSGTYMCYYVYGGNDQLLYSMVWMLNTVWEVLTLCLSAWVTVKHFRELRRLGPSTGSTIGDYFGVLIQSHVLYFASFAGVSCIQLTAFSTGILNSTSIGALTLDAALQILLVVQLFVLGPRLILSVREYHSKLVAYSDAETGLNSIVFQERVHVTTSSTV
ncbi:uncharacterized protein HD556DRAFT_1529301 [Suillus plorans]|uniref:DUF6533 domain-containing protein n=1 Tax=Suillus plorans TaxID=116603 RepID=A0A9P7AHL8_9AGAM|nr:uncharacterized protein HD556DRAFT_1529301 [Suillus plorans]KAG1789733.1 hypothetical protein HD556DRAFT_1529301 [Suillus plorans]